MKTILVPFIGGMDLTYLALKNLQDGHKIRLLYVELRNNINQHSAQLMAINNIVEELKKRYGTEKIELITAGNIEVTTLKYSENDLTQPFIWITFSVFYTDGVDEIHFGYIMNDCATSYINEIKNIWNSLIEFNYEKRNIEIKFPIMKINKKQIYRLLTENNLIDYTSYCENPVFHEEKYYPCDDCKSCKRMVYDGFVNKTKDYIEPVVDIAETHENN
jgi:7-cyano-7-deazaguanine synthase in queuosine biosynthesis